MAMMSIESALDLVLAAASRLSAETVQLEYATGRVLAQDVLADRDSPPFSKAMMDGFAVCGAAVEPGRAMPIKGEVAAGAVDDVAVPSGSAVRIMTGAPIPPGVDAVIPIEVADVSDDEGSVAFEAVPRERANVLAQGSIARKGDVVLAEGRTLGSPQIAALAEFGVAEVSVVVQPRVAILATGDELVPCNVQPGPGQIRNSNGPMLIALVKALGGRPISLGIAADNVEDLDRLIASGLEADVLLLSGGVSAGRYDLVPDRMSAAGVTSVFHKVAIKPGKPIWFGHTDETLVFGLPGNPVSSLVCCEVFVQAAIRKMLGSSPAVEPSELRRLSKSHVQKGDRSTYWPARRASDERGPTVEPLDWNGSADLATVAEADCWAVFPPGTREFGIGEPVEVVLHCG